MQYNTFKRLIISSSILIIFLFNLSSAGSCQPGGGYLTYDQMTSTIKSLVSQHPGLARLESLGQTAKGRDLWVLTLAKENTVPVSERPGLLIAANFEGDHLIGSSLAVATAEYLLTGYGTDQEVTTCLDQSVVYIIPRMNPDGAEQMFAPIVSGQKTNTTPFDADNDGRLDEDGPEDLNGDGLITVFRVKDDKGLYRISTEDPLLMKKAEPSKGERGEYSIYPEGIDNDKDGFINEDAAGGTDLNRNFMHAYPYYKENAGKYMVSEPETRALIEWMLKHRNVAIVLTYGESDNLITPPNTRGNLSSDRPLDLPRAAIAQNAGANKVGMIQAGRGGFDRFSFMMGGGMPRGSAAETGGTQTTAASSRAMRGSRTAATTFNTADLDYFTKVSEKYKELTGIRTAPVLRNPEGAFFQYAYFQFGVPSFSTPGWGIVLPPDTTRRGRPGGGRVPGNIEAPTDMGANAAAGGGQTRTVQTTGGGGPGGGDFPGSGGMGTQGMQSGRQQETESLTPGIDATFLKYLKANNPSGFVKWQPVKHPEYGEVEVGGFSPADISNPPAGQIQELGTGHAKFAVFLTTLYAKITIAKTEVINEGGGLFRIKADISNEGFLPMAIRQGVQARAVKPTMVQLEIKPEKILSGNNKTNFIQSLDGSGIRVSYEWLVKGKSGDQIPLKVVSEKAGTATTNITLK